MAAKIGAAIMDMLPVSNCNPFPPKVPVPFVQSVYSEKRRPPFSQAY